MKKTSMIALLGGVAALACSPAARASAVNAPEPSHFVAQRMDLGTADVSSHAWGLGTLYGGDAGDPRLGPWEFGREQFDFSVNPPGTGINAGTSTNVAATPEPAALLLLATGLLGLGVVKRRALFDRT